MTDFRIPACDHSSEGRNTEKPPHSTHTHTHTWRSLRAKTPKEVTDVIGVRVDPETSGGGKKPP